MQLFERLKLSQGKKRQSKRIYSQNKNKSVLAFLCSLQNFVWPRGSHSQNSAARRIGPITPRDSFSRNPAVLSSCCLLLMMQELCTEVSARAFLEEPNAFTTMLARNSYLPACRHCLSLFIFLGFLSHASVCLWQNLRHMLIPGCQEF